MLLRLHYLETFSLERLATLQQVHTSTIKRRLAEARADALAAVRKLLRERLRLSDDEGMSLLRFLESRMDLSLRSAFSISRPGEAPRPSSAAPIVHRRVLHQGWQTSLVPSEKSVLSTSRDPAVVPTVSPVPPYE